MLWVAMKQLVKRQRHLLPVIVSGIAKNAKSAFTANCRLVLYQYVLKLHSHCTRQNNWNCKICDPSFRSNFWITKMVIQFSVWSWITNAIYSNCQNYQRCKVKKSENAQQSQQFQNCQNVRNLVTCQLFQKCSTKIYQKLTKKSKNASESQKFTKG